MKTADLILRAAPYALVLGALVFLASTTEAAITMCPHPQGGSQNPIAGVGETVDCWVGQTWETGTTMARGRLSEFSGGMGNRKVEAYLFNTVTGFITNCPSYSALSRGYNKDNLPTCDVADTTRNGQWVASTATACTDTAYIRVRAYCEDY